MFTKIAFNQNLLISFEAPTLFDKFEARKSCQIKILSKFLFETTWCERVHVFDRTCPVRFGTFAAILKIS